MTSPKSISEQSTELLSHLLNLAKNWPLASENMALYDAAYESLTERIASLESDSRMLGIWKVRYEPERYGESKGEPPR